MFTGIIEASGVIEKITQEGTNRHFQVKSSISHELHVDQSVSHNGVCLTVTKVESGFHWVTAIEETLLKSTLGDLKSGQLFNLERCMLNNGRFDGHIVQGHVDQTGTVHAVKDQHGSWLVQFRYDPSQGNITVEKGSIGVDGVSLTCFESSNGKFSVAIIPYTWENTNFRYLEPGHLVNLEFDIIGKYVKRLMEGD